jgi:metallo-beta-lactamase class B
MKQKNLIYFLLLFFTTVCMTFSLANPDPGKPLSPFRIAGNLYFVGNTYVANYLIVTSQGNILINSDYEEDVPMIKANIEKLGFKFGDTKILLISHAHADHSGGSALIKKETGAKYMVMVGDVPDVESGGKTDFQYSNSSDPDMFYQPTKVDRILHNGDQVELGDTVLIAHLTAGHTKGCTTWTMKVTEEGKQYNVVIVGGPFVNPGYKLLHNSAYPNIAEDYKHMFNTLKSLPCDIFLGAHGMYFGLEEKYALMKKGQINPFIDPKGYKKFIALKEQDFYSALAKARQSEA